MARGLATGLLVGGLLLTGACRADTVRVEATPQVGDRARFRYEIDATVTRAIDGEPAETTTAVATLLVSQRIVSVTSDGVEADVTLRRDGGAARTARVRLDRAGALRGVELVDGLPGPSLGLSELGSLLPPTVAPPSRALRPGDEWSTAAGATEGRGRLVRLGIIDGEEVAVVRTTVAEAIDEDVAAGPSVATLTGVLRTQSTVSYDLVDGSLRRSSARSRGAVRARIEAPTGVDAAPVLATITYDIRVTATRLA
ncbi:MAG: hypothetical protein ACT4OV_13160 [Microthrixaceae bacterium]